MPRFAANLSTLYQEYDFLDRFAAAREDGFKAVEVQWLHTYLVEALAQRLSASDLQLVLLNAPCGDFAAGERGLAALPGREAEFRESLDVALRYARALQCPRIHLLSGIVTPEASRDEYRQTLIDNLCHAAPLAAQAGVTLLIEPINPRDMPGYFLNHQHEAHAFCAAVRERSGLNVVKVQMDLYHCQIVEGDLSYKLRQYLSVAGSVDHIQIASVPGRHEPDDEGEIHYSQLFQLIDALGYSGWVGCEYFPRTTTRTGLGWMRQARAMA